MKENDIEKKVIEITANVLETPAKEITKDTNLVTDLGAESLDLVDLVVAFEDEFNVEVADEDIASIQTISDIVDYISSH